LSGPLPSESTSATSSAGVEPLYRLTAADYSTGDYYHYTYDAVGNRLEQTSMVSGLSSMVDYDYDDANRLTSAGGVTYTWDNNGNLLNDGVNTYTYDAANRLSTIVNLQSEIVNRYNGLGDRLQETLNGQTTTFTMDFNTGLTQALSDGTNTYIYGNGRIAQAEGAGTEYFLGDALGSVRQLTNNSGAITYASAYDPYGVATQTYGASQTAYGYTGEYASNDMVYLRARMYAPGMGRFLTSDPSGAEANLYLYAGANPVNRIDPTGLFSREQIAKSFGFNNFESVLAYYDRHGEHWGFIATLLRALPGDDLMPQSIAIRPLLGPPLKWATRSSRIYRKIGYDNMSGITFDGMPLSTMIRTNSSWTPTKGPGLAPIWRNDDAIFYTLRDLSGNDEEYVNGSYMTDLPDFWTTSISGGEFGVAGQGQYIMDRFGQSYFSGGGYFSFGVIPVEITYGEGYIGEPVTSGTHHSIRMLPTQAELKDKIRGFTICFGLSGNIPFIGAGASACSNRTLVSVYTVGVQAAGVSGLFNPSLTRPFRLDSNQGWNWVNEARKSGVMRRDLLNTKEIPFDGCNNNIPLSGR